MTPEAFTYWLAGYFEISNSDELTKSQVKTIKDHINLVLNKVTPSNNLYCHKSNVIGGLSSSQINPQSGLLC
jgi:hypothetical protein